MMRTTRLLLCSAARSHMTPQLMTAFPPSETPSAYSWARASPRGPSGDLLHLLKKLHICGDGLYFLWVMCASPKIPNTQGTERVFDRCGTFALEPAYMEQSIDAAEHR